MTNDEFANEPAFPIKISDGVRAVTVFDGLSRRELFAVMIMQGLVSRNEAPFLPTCAELSVSGADMLIDQLNKT